MLQCVNAEFQGNLAKASIFFCQNKKIFWSNLKTKKKLIYGHCGLKLGLYKSINLILYTWI